MSMQPKVIALDQIAELIAEKFKTKDEITCYVGSNAATPTACLMALTDAIRLRRPRLPFIKMVHLLLQGPAQHQHQPPHRELAIAGVPAQGAPGAQPGTVPLLQIDIDAQWVQDVMAQR